MENISFDATIKGGYIKIPKKYSSLNNRRVSVEISSSIKEEPDKEKIVEEFLRKYTGMLKNTGLPPDITTKQIREMRLKEKYGV
jgi:hypothetical protein